MNDIKVACPSAVSVHNEHGRSKIVLVCEHASSHMPAEFDGLGLPRSKLKEHIAWDIGALQVAKRLADLLDAPLVHANVSRLILDINREPGHRGSIPEISESTEILANKGLSAAARSARVRSIYEPFHETLASVVGRRRFDGGPWVISIHSYTPIYKGFERPWHVGILHNEDMRLSTKLLTALKQDESLIVGDNEPYAPSDGVYHTIERHTASAGYVGAMVEIRNDLIHDATGQSDWAARFHRILMECMQLKT